MCIFRIILLLGLSFYGCHFVESTSGITSIYIPDLPDEKYISLGDFNIGVLIPVHVRSITSFCGPSVLDLGLLQRLEAIVFAIEEINQSASILPNHTLGYVIFDDCHSDLTALAQTLHFARTVPPEDCLADDVPPAPPNVPLPPPTLPEDCDNRSRVDIYDVIGVISSEQSITTLQSANLLSSFRIPQISYFATTPTLSNKAKYPLFQRTVPADTIQAKVILQLLARFNWTYIYVIYSEGTYGEGLYRAMEKTLLEESADRTICFSEPIIIRQDFTMVDYKMMLLNMLQDRFANVTLIIAQDFEAREIMKAASNIPAEDKFTWIASDAWARNINHLGEYVEAALGTISLNIFSAPVPRFDGYFQQIRSTTDTDNPWIDLFWEQYFNCSRLKNGTLQHCRNTTALKDHSSYFPENTLSHIFDAVKTYALGVDTQIKSTCEGLTNGDLLHCVKSNFSQVLHNISFTGEAGDIVKYDEIGDRVTPYIIYNIQKTNESGRRYKMVRVGEWSPESGQLEIDADLIQWSRGRKPLSNCSRPCAVGEAMELQQKRCCWSCVPCADDQITRTYLGLKSCFSCSEGQWPDPETRTECLAIVPMYLSISEAIGAAIFAMGTIGITVSALVLVLYVLNNSHQLIKACSRELSYLMLFGIIVSYAFVFAFIIKPSDEVCFVTQLGVVIAFTIVYAPLTIKTIRIWRVFESGKRLNRRPKCVGNSSQILLAFLTILLHASMVAIWSVFDPPYPDNVHSGPGKLDLVCSFPLGPFIASMSFNILLLLICSVFAFKTRKLPDNFNESRFISFCAFSTAILWMAFIASYFLTESVYRVLFLVLMLCVNGFILLGGLFIPKIFAIYFVHKKEMHLKACAKMADNERSHIHQIHSGPFILANNQSVNDRVNSAMYRPHPGTQPLTTLSPTGKVVQEEVDQSTEKENGHLTTAHPVPLLDTDVKEQEPSSEDNVNLHSPPVVVIRRGKVGPEPGEKECHTNPSSISTPSEEKVSHTDLPNPDASTMAEEKVSHTGLPSDASTISEEKVSHTNLPSNISTMSEEKDSQANHNADVSTASEESRIERPMLGIRALTR